LAKLVKRQKKMQEKNDQAVLEVKDFILRQENSEGPLEIWIDILSLDSVSLSGENKIPATLNNDILFAQVAPNVLRQIPLDTIPQEILTTHGGVMVFCGPSGIVAKGDLALS